MCILSCIWQRVYASVCVCVQTCKCSHSICPRLQGLRGFFRWGNQFSTAAIRSPLASSCVNPTQSKWRWIIIYPVVRWALYKSPRLIQSVRLAFMCKCDHFRRHVWYTSHSLSMVSAFFLFFLGAMFVFVYSTLNGWTVSQKSIDFRSTFVAMCPARLRILAGGGWQRLVLTASGAIDRWTFRLRKCVPHPESFPTSSKITDWM